MAKVVLERISGDFGFRGKDDHGNSMQTDSSLENGGSNFGFRPMQTLLMALGSCSAIDIVIILKKQRQRIESFRMEINGEREQEKEPSLWRKIHILFLMEGNIDEAKARKACQLSVEKYCSVAETLRRAGAEITWGVNVINKEKKENETN